MSLRRARAVTPRERIAAECSRRGQSDVVSGCRALLRGEPVDPGLLLALGGPAAQAFIADPHRPDDYWLRVWAARGLLWACDDTALPELASALADESWRVREMAAKVSARHQLDDLADDLEPLLLDPVPRVRLAADRALRVLAR